jgi:hypothetical protein
MLVGAGHSGGCRPGFSVPEVRTCHSFKHLEWPLSGLNKYEWPGRSRWTCSACLQMEWLKATTYIPVGDCSVLPMKNACRPFTAQCPVRRSVIVIWKNNFFSFFSFQELELTELWNSRSFFFFLFYTWHLSSMTLKCFQKRFCGNISLNISV